MKKSQTVKTAMIVKEETLQQQAIGFLKKELKPGRTIYHALKSVSSSGMTRQISFYIIKGKQIISIDWYLSNALDMKRNPANGALKVSGCSMDMGFSIVYNIGRKVFPKGFKLAKGQYGRNGDKSGFDNDGGYAFKSQWI